MLLPNTDSVKASINRKTEEINLWFMKHFETDLFMADGWAECSANELKNVPEGSYSELYRTISRQISGRKSHRYTASHIKMLNSAEIKGDRECTICRHSAKLDDNGHCSICAALERLSGAILYQDYFAVMQNAPEDALPLPGEKYLLAGGKEKLLSLMNSDDYVRSYTKNQMYTGKHVTTKLWVGNYNVKGDTFGDLALKAKGIKRIAVLRADVDNLGNTFVNGFKGNDGSGRYETLSRTAALSRQLSLFFKCYINSILKNGESNVLSDGKSRQVDIVYSGGDDIFIAGAWNDVIDAFIDIRNAFKRFTLDSVTLSGGVGIYDSSYPINRMAAETAILEDYSKSLEGKAAATLFDRSGRYKWEEFVADVIDEKLVTLNKYLKNTDLRGKAFLYKLLELLRNDDERFNRARFVYYLSRIEPSANVHDDNEKAEQENFREFAAKMYTWSMDAEERRKVVTAIYLYVYLTRESEEDGNENN